MLGDILEWIAGACLVTAAFLWLGAPLALAAAFVFLMYQAQCHAGTEFRLFKKKTTPVQPGFVEAERVTREDEGSR